MPPPLRRSDLLADNGLTGRAFCDAYGDLVEAWLCRDLRRGHRR